MNRISSEQVALLYASVRTKSPELHEQDVAFYVCIGVLIHFMGDEWLNDYVLEGAKNQNVLSYSQSDDIIRSNIKRFMLMSLAETIFNLQYVEGISECLERLRCGDIEGTLAELGLGMMLFLHGVSFRYVVPVSKKGEDYDVQITCPNGTVACADAKCKIEGREFSEKTLKNTLEGARKQLPKDKPGIVFVKHPTEWASGEVYKDAIFQVTRKFLLQTERIVSVKYYVEPYEVQGTQIMHRHGFLEYSNPVTRFGNDVDWSLFPKGYLKNLEAPAHWTRIILLPANNQKN